MLTIRKGWTQIAPCAALREVNKQSKMKKFLSFSLLLIVFVANTTAAERQPNIIFILADDLGWADVGFHGGNAPTPNLDKLARESVELTQHYVYPACTPTRASLLSGRYATRFGVTTPLNTRVFPWATITLARALKSVGYDTALFGKWHLGSRPEWGPQKFGFDRSYGSLAGGVGPWDHRYKTGEFSITWHRDGKLIEEEGHVTDLITREAVQRLEVRSERPFLLYLAYSAVHIPIREPDEYLERVPAEITERSRREYAAGVMHLDHAVGRVLAALRKTGKADNTLVIFTGDNGGYPDARNDDPKYPPDNYPPGPAGGDNRPLRGMKLNVYEGGIRVPTLVHWPARLKPGKLTPPIHISDWMPTFCALAGYRAEKDLRWDGRNIWPILAGLESPAPRTIYVASPNFESQAIRDGDWKLIAQQAGGLELFDLASDPNETTNVAPTMPDKVAALRAKLAEAAKADGDAIANEDSSRIAQRREDQNKTHLHEIIYLFGFVVVVIFVVGRVGLR